MKPYPRASRVSSLTSLLFAALLLAPPASLHAADANSRCQYPAGAVLNLCEAPYSADPTGKRDSTEAILRALDNVTRITQLAFRQGVLEVEMLPANGTHCHSGCWKKFREKIKHTARPALPQFLRLPPCFGTN